MHYTINKKSKYMTVAEYVKQTLEIKPNQWQAIGCRIQRLPHKRDVLALLASSVEVIDCIAINKHAQIVCVSSIANSIRITVDNVEALNLVDCI